MTWLIGLSIGLYVLGMFPTNTLVKGDARTVLLATLFWPVAVLIGVLVITWQEGFLR